MFLVVWEGWPVDQATWEPYWRVKADLGPRFKELADRLWEGEDVQTGRLEVLNVERVKRGFREREGVVAKKRKLEDGDHADEGGNPFFDNTVDF